MERKEFSFETIEDFDAHIALSIPGYKQLIEHVIKLSTYFVKHDTTVYDLGCSTGVLSERIANENSNIEFVYYIGIDKSENMLKLREEWIETGVKSNMEIADLLEYDLRDASLITSIFTLQFIDYKDRLKILKNIYKGLKKGGALIIAEKTLSSNAFNQELMTFVYYDFKKKAFSEKEIMDKQRDLRQIMTPISYNANMRLFEEAGFTKITQFWQSLNFIGWILIK